MARRRVVVRDTDVLVIKGFEVDASVLADITTPGKRLLWAFVLSEDGTCVRPICFSEDRVIWLTEEDLARKEF